MSDCARVVAPEPHPLAPRASRVGPVAGGRGPAGGSVTHSPESPLFERRAGLGGPTPLARRDAPPGATHPVTLEAIATSLSPNQLFPGANG